MPFVGTESVMLVSRARREQELRDETLAERMQEVRDKTRAEREQQVKHKEGARREQEVRDEERANRMQEVINEIQQALDDIYEVHPNCPCGDCVDISKDTDEHILQYLHEWVQPAYQSEVQILCQNSSSEVKAIIQNVRKQIALEHTSL